MSVGSGKKSIVNDLDVSDVNIDDVDLFRVDVSDSDVFSDEDEEAQEVSTIKEVGNLVKKKAVVLDPALEEYVFKVIKKLSQLKAVQIDRERFLRTELAKFCPPEQVEEAVKTSPSQAGVDETVIEKIKDGAISLETKMVSGLSFAAGIPGGLALGVTVPLDTANYIAYSLRIEQKLAYLYGWESFFDDEDEVSDDTIYQFILFLGVMMGVGGAAVALKQFALTTARQGVVKAVQKQALTKTTFYPVLKKILRVLGVKMTKPIFAKGVGKIVPVVGGVISGGMTYATFKPGAHRLAKHLATLPQAKAESQ